MKLMTDRLRHRGPDGEGFFVDRDIAFGHRRLAIIDITSGSQPMKDPESKTVVIYNGEIYNYIEIKNRLKAEGFHFHTRSDTEVLIRSYRRWGMDCLRRFNGMFAFGLWDGIKRQLFICRDRLGIKPLYYYQSGPLFIFASELQAIQALPDLRLNIDPAALSFYSTIGYIPAPFTIFKEIRKLEPGCYLKINKDTISKIRYWKTDFRCKKKRSVDLLLKEIPERLHKAVSSQMISDVPLGAFLSGGIDSASVVAMMSRSSGESISTFSMGFNEKAYDERPLSRLVSERYRTEHHELLLKPNALNILEKLVQHFGEPFADSSALPTYYLSEMTRKHVKVALSGDGGDELFCGYTIYLGHRVSELYRILPDKIRKIILKSLLGLKWSKHDEINRHLSFFQKRMKDIEHAPVKRILVKNHMFSENLRQQVFHDIDVSPVEYMFAKLLRAETAEDFLDRIANLQLNLSLPDDMLAKVDRMSMLHSLEVRVPFLDHEFVEYCATIPVSTRFKYRKTKWLLRKAMKPYLPKPIINAGKRGFTVPLYYWLKTDEQKNGLYDSNDTWGRLIYDQWKYLYQNARNQQARQNHAVKRAV